MSTQANDDKINAVLYRLVDAEMAVAAARKRYEETQDETHLDELPRLNAIIDQAHKDYWAALAERKPAAKP